MKLSSIVRERTDNARRSKHQADHRHADAMRSPRADEEAGIVKMIEGLAAYADAYQRRFDSPIGEDHVLGEAWIDALRGVRALLNGELGRLDGGQTDGVLVAMAEAAGFEDSDL